jgi:hypothetical protein
LKIHGDPLENLGDRWEDLGDPWEGLGDHEFKEIRLSDEIFKDDKNCCKMYENQFRFHEISLDGETIGTPNFLEYVYKKSKVWDAFVDIEWAQLG